MLSSSNQRVQKFLSEIQEFAPEKYKILQKLRKIVHTQFSEVNERIIYGGIMFTLSEDFGGIFPYQNHISFEFSQGYLLKDPDNLLEGKGKFRRHLKIKELKDIEAKNVVFFIKQIQI